LTEEHGRYLPRSERKSEPECPKSPTGKHCWHFVDYDYEWEEKEQPFYHLAGGFRTYSVGRRCKIFRCCWCGKEERSGWEEVSSIDL